jgi:hypothetical protein
MSMHKIKIDKQPCPLCKKRQTESSVEFINGQYRTITICKNEDCISNKLHNKDYVVIKE